MPIDIGEDASQLLATSRAFKNLDDAAVLKSLRKSLRTAAKPIADKAKENASFSPWIAKTIGITVSFTGKKSGVFITARGSKMPAGKKSLPKLMENEGQEGTFRHPVFGRDVWVEQKAHPYLQPALDGQEDKIAEQIRTDIAQQIESAGLEVK